MKVAVIGAGSLGLLLSARMAKVHEVHLVARRDADALREGVRCGTDAPPVRLAGVHESLPPLSFDAIVVAVKSYDLPEAMGELSLSHASCPVALPQNGILHYEPAVSALGSRAVFLSVTYGARLAAPGIVIPGGEGEMGVAGIGSDGEEAKRVLTLLREAGLNTHMEPDAKAMVYAKAGVNCCINPLTVLLRCENGRLPKSEYAREVMAQVAAEFEAVAAAEGVNAQGVFGTALDVCKATSSNRSSMLQDVEAGRRTEIDALNLAIAAMGERRGVACFANRTLGNLVKGVESASKATL